MKVGDIIRGRTYLKELKKYMYMLCTLTFCPILNYFIINTMDVIQGVGNKVDLIKAFDEFNESLIQGGFFQEFSKVCDLSPHQHSDAFGCTKNYQPIGMTEHLQCVES